MTNHSSFSPSFMASCFWGCVVEMQAPTSPKTAEKYMAMLFWKPFLAVRFSRTISTTMIGPTIQKMKAWVFLERPKQQTSVIPRLRFEATTSQPWQKAIMLQFITSQIDPVSIMVAQNQRNSFMAAMLTRMKRQIFTFLMVPNPNTQPHRPFSTFPKQKTRIIVHGQTLVARQQTPVTMSPRQMMLQMAKKGPGGVTIRLNLRDTAPVFFPRTTEAVIIPKVVMRASTLIGQASTDQLSSPIISILDSNIKSTSLKQGPSLEEKALKLARQKLAWRMS